VRQAGGVGQGEPEGSGESDGVGVGLGSGYGVGHLGEGVGVGVGVCVGVCVGAGSGEPSEPSEPSQLKPCKRAVEQMLFGPLDITDPRPATAATAMPMMAAIRRAYSTAAAPRAAFRRPLPPSLLTGCTLRMGALSEGSVRTSIMRSTEIGGAARAPLPTQRR
jgi:hypothetical protein